MVATTRGVRCPPAPSRGRSIVWPSWLWSRCTELSSPLSLPILYGAMIVQQQWGGAMLIMPWAGKCGVEAVVGPLIVWAWREPLLAL